MAIAIQLLDSATGRIVKSYSYDETRSARGINKGSQDGVTVGMFVNFPAAARR